MYIPVNKMTNAFNCMLCIYLIIFFEINLFFIGGTPTAFSLPVSTFQKDYIDSLLSCV